jgi:hypothetical protein
MNPKKAESANPKKPITTKRSNANLIGKGGESGPLMSHSLLQQRRSARAATQWSSDREKCKLRLAPFSFSPFSRSLPRHVDFHRNVPGYWEVDDHDSWINDGWPTANAPWMNPLTFEQGFDVYREQVPMGDLT